MTVSSQEPGFLNSSYIFNNRIIISWNVLLGVQSMRNQVSEIFIFSLVDLVAKNLDSKTLAFLQQPIDLQEYDLGIVLICNQVSYFMFITGVCGQQKMTFLQKKKCFQNSSNNLCSIYVISWSMICVGCPIGEQ